MNASPTEPVEESKMTNSTLSSMPERVLIVFAHPDDETWMNGTVAKIASQNNQLHLIYATSGDKGDDVSGQNLKDQKLATVREQETLEALKSLGVDKNVEFLRFPDSDLHNAVFPLAQKIKTRIDSIDPQLVITFGPGGVTGHTDHIAAGLATQLAFDQSSRPSILYNIAISQDRVDVLSRASEKYGIDQYRPVEQVSALTTLKVDVARQTELRKKSLHAHKTQFPEPLVRAWADFVEVSKYEEFIVSRHRGGNLGLE